ncbi:MAG: double zinc ribbon domain-containing protein, partial [Candidatus Rokuibacteriota bacterium]
MICPRCQAANQEGRRFCGRCGGRLPRACPACGFANDAGDRFCGGCGAALLADQSRGGTATLAVDPTPGSGAATTRPPATAADASPAAPASYTPAHLARKILDARATLEGERKQVTVLFADL